MSVAKEKWENEYKGPSNLELVGFAIYEFEYLLAVSCWVIHSASLSLGFLTCNIGIIIASPCPVIVRNKDHTCKELSIVPGR